ncbi:serine/threonine protein phosphatase 2A 57 kDa regulatory subunit B' beta isoform-like [Tasmannia lanceolata]|uniref:serine/threonine protein phosphatase 2A 57 kDa regulatory subunit B' beta isoform-like n=1 Tax=Tasmannia lanceolata TaxID=3420 RepID=UPI0040636737
MHKTKKHLNKRRREKKRRKEQMGAQKNAPIASPMKKSITLKYLFDIDSKSTNYEISNPSFDPETDELLSIISYCTFVFTFTDPSESPSKQELKRHKLLQLLTIIKSNKKPFDNRVLSPLFAMFAVNLFRPLPPPQNSSISSDSTEDEEYSSTPTPSWPHLHVIYDILLKLILTSDPKSLREYIGQSFLRNLLSLFRTEDRRERDSLKNIYHRIYSKFTFYRKFMRKSTNDIFLHFVFESERHCGIGELLEIWGSIINGFTVPLKEEHKLFLMRVLLPLHKPKGIQAYHRQLAYCVSQFVQKEPMLGGIVVRGILRYWPLTNCQKEVLLLGEVEELVEYTDPGQFPKLAVPICSQMARCLNSWNSQVAERALYLWNNEQFVKIVSEAMEEALPAVVEAIEKNIKWHWNKTVRQQTVKVKKMLEDLEPSLYSKCATELNLRESMADQEEMKRKEKWERLEMAASNNQFLQQQNCISISH